ncbi:MAG: hypothetical protein ABIN80_30480 [Dyadobacter sp.]|uniref:hypothetical protein n=1 Tax=Dyadobacter sp. TaxID=1914288 RepID=UPI003262F569
MDSVNFEYIGDNKLRDILIRDQNEMELCLKNGAAKSVLVLAGSIIETILIDILSHHISGSRDEFLKKQLYQLIDIAHAEKIISDKSKDLLSILRGYRNLIHPGREVRENERFDINTAKIAVTLVAILSTEIKSYLIDRYGFSANDIIEKLEKDETSAELFKELLLRLNQREKHALYFLLRDYKPGRRALQRTLADNLRPLIYRLRPFLSNDFVLEQLKDLVVRVQVGEAKEILSLYRIWHKDLRLLPDRDSETILLYIINYIDYNVYTILEQGIYSSNLYGLTSISHYIASERTLVEFKRLVKSILSAYQGEVPLVRFFIEIFDRLGGNDKIEVENYILNEMPIEITGDFLMKLADLRKADDDLPF